MTPEPSPGPSRARDGIVTATRASLTFAVLFTAACANEPEPAAIHLIDAFPHAAVDGAVEVRELPPTMFRTFEDGAEGWQALYGIEELAVRDGLLVGRVSERPVFSIPGLDDPDPDDAFHALEIKARVSDGTSLGVWFSSKEELEIDKVPEWAEESSYGDFNVDLEPGPDLVTYRFTGAHSLFDSSYPLTSIRHILVRPTDAAGATFEIESIRLVSRNEHLASIPSGVGWQGLGEVYRETVVARSGERITFTVDLPSDPYFDLSIGALDGLPVSYRVEVDDGTGSRELLRRTVTTPQRWEAVPIELGAVADRSVRLTLTAESEREGNVALWGAPVIRNRAGQVAMTDASEAHAAVVGDEQPPPRGVILVVADTLRRDRLPFYGAERDNTPVLSAMAAEGAVFLDPISQATWTKVSFPSLLASLYPTTHGIKDMPDKLPAAVTTLAEAYRNAGYATFATSSVPFSGKLTNLHQGVEVLHESTSLDKVEHSDSKTARRHVDSLLDWLDGHHDVPFFALLHAFDPHSPYEPYRPYDATYLSADELDEHRKRIEAVQEVMTNDFMKHQALPFPEDLEKAEIPEAEFIAAEHAWYDASIRAMDVEIGRLLERLESLGLADDTLIAFVSDHGEEFREHGRIFHGYHTYGEMLNVPLMFWWPGGLPGGVEVTETVQTIDMMPTLLELSRLPVPERAQGQSLLPLMTRDGSTSTGWNPRPAFAERAYAPAAFESDDPIKLDSRAMIHGGWKLIHNVSRPDDWPEYELFDHRDDPLNLVNVADEHPEIVERMAKTMAGWHAQALAAKVESDESVEDLSPAELEKLRSLGYIE